MANTSEVGAAEVNVKSYQCSIEKVTATTKWKAPNREVAENVSITVYDNTSRVGKSIYIISSPEGKKVTVNAKRDSGECQREEHKKYKRLWDDFVKDDTQTDSKSSFNPLGLLAVKSPLDPYSFKRNPREQEEEIKENVCNIKCYEVGGAYQALSYISLPIPIDKNYVTTFKYYSCKEGMFQWRIISYPDISFKVEFAIGTDAVKNKNKTSKFERNTKNYSYHATQLKDINANALDTNIEFSPSLTAMTIYNGGEDQLEIKFNFDKEEEFCTAKYKHGSREEEYGSKLFNIRGTIKKVKDLCSLISKISKIDFLKEFTQFDAKDLVSNYKPYKLKLGSPNVLFSYEGQYHTSKDLTRIGKYIDFCFACEPLLSISFTIDLLFLILSAVSAGTATGFYVMLKNLDKVIGKILGDNYKQEYRKKYKNTKPFEFDVYFNFIITGAVNGSIHWIIDTTEKKDPNSNSGYIEGVVKADLEAGAKCKLDLIIVAVEGEASASGSTGIKIKLGIENHMLQGRGWLYLVEGIFLGLKVNYIITGKVGLMSTKKYGGDLLNGDATLLPKTTLFSKQWTIFDD